MATKSDAANCTTVSWAVAALTGVLVFLMLLVLGGWGFLASSIVGIVILVAAGFFITWAFCAPLGAADAPKASGTGAGTSAAVPSASAGPDAPAQSVRAAAPHSQPTAVVPPAAASPAPVQDRTAEVPLTATHEADAAAAVPAASKSAAPAQAPQPASGADAGGPELLDAPRGAADDLKQIKGVGPKLEEKLNAFGIWHHAQIAAWSAADIAWVDERLSLRGRVERDDWVAQARILASGGETEFSRRAGGRQSG